MRTENEIIDDFTTREYEYGFVTNIDMDVLPTGLNEKVIQFISAKKEEPEGLLEWRMKGYKAFLNSDMRHWQNFKAPEVNFQDISYYAAPKNQQKYDSLDAVDPVLLQTYARLGIAMEEQNSMREA